MKNRQEILDRAFTRGPFPGMRQLTGGIFILGKTLGLQKLLSKEERRADIPPAELALESIALTWLLDAAVSLDHIRAAVAHGGREHVFAELLPTYGDAVPVLKMRYALRELALVNEELAAAEFSIEPKPDEKPGDTPSGKS